MTKIYKKISGAIKRIGLYRLFVKKNSDYWNGNKYLKRESIVMVEISEKNPFELETTMRIAKAIQKIYGYRIDVVYSGFSSISEPYSKLVKSYGIDKIYFLKRY